jgi:hypothetical protein
MTDPTAETTTAAVDLYWLPLGAGGHCVRWNGRVFETLLARHQHREARDLYHSALQVQIDHDRFVIEMTPAWAGTEVDRGVVCRGAVGLPWAGRSRFFTYEVRCWRNGTIPDVAEAVASPRRLSTDAVQARHVLELVADFPTATWGRDEMHTGDMWNSNSLVSWLLTCSGYDTDAIDLPAAGRAPGWDAGRIVAARREAFSAEV